MELHEDIASFIYLLNTEPNTFLPTAWRDLPSLEAEIAKLADDESSIAETIKNWCIERELGEELRDNLSRARKDFGDAGEPTPTTQQMLTNTTQTLRQAIEEACQKLQQLDAQKSDKGNDSK